MKMANQNNRGMQECFREYPDIYGAELEPEDEEEGSESVQRSSQGGEAEEIPNTKKPQAPEQTSGSKKTPSKDDDTQTVDLPPNSLERPSELSETK
jgi:intermembrane space import and assembly protein 40